MPAGVFFYPFRLAALASSPKGTPYGNAGNFIATAKSRPLGEGGCERSEQTEGVFPEQVALHLSRKPSRYAKGSLPEGAGTATAVTEGVYSSQMAVAPQGTTPPVAETGRPISSQLVLPPKRGTSVVLSIYSMTAGDRPVV